MSVTAKYPGVCDGCGTHMAGGCYCESCLRSAADLEAAFARCHGGAEGDADDFEALPLPSLLARVRARLWILNLAFVLGGLAYLWLEWLR